MGNKSGYTSAGKTALDKAQKFADQVKPHGWECKISQIDSTTTLFGRRNDSEILEIWWHGNTITVAPKYTLAGEPIKLRNVSAAISIATKAADTSRLGKAARRRTRRVASAETTDDAPTLPDAQAFTVALGLAEADDAGVRALLDGRSIEWLNSQSGNIESARVAKLNKIVRNGHDYVEFVDERGFHAVYIDKIVSVG